MDARHSIGSPDGDRINRGESGFRFDGGIGTDRTRSWLSLHRRRCLCGLDETIEECFWDSFYTRRRSRGIHCFFSSV